MNVKLLLTDILDRSAVEICKSCHVPNLECKSLSCLLRKVPLYGI
jgi:hypothetical protein